jgi:diguanylate cyclase (GGDEF)-like protein/PAS domain S-box-containing protein
VALRAARIHDPAWTWRTWAAQLLVASAYVLAAQAGFHLTMKGVGAPAIWGPSGIAIAAVVLGGYRMLPAIAAGAVVAELSAGEPTLAVIGIAIGEALAAAAGATLMKRYHVDPALERIKDVAGLVVLGAIAATSISALIHVGSLALAGAHQDHSLATLRAWWLGGVVGVLLAASPILVFARAPLELPDRGRLAAAVLLLTTLVVGAILTVPTNSPLAFGALPLILLLAIEYGQRGAILGCVITSVNAVWYTAHGQGLFLGGSHATELIRVQMFTVVAACFSMLAAAARTERLVAENALAQLAESERALASAQSLAHLGSFEWDVASDTTTLSDELRRIYGLEETAGVAFETLWQTGLHEGDIDHVNAVALEALAHRRPYSVVYRIVRPDGVIRTLECHAQFEVDAEGEAVRLLGSVQDITAFKRAEDRFRGLLETAPDAIVIVDEEGAIVLVNSQTERLFGYVREDLIGQSIDRLVPSGFADAANLHRESYVTDPDAGPIGSELDLLAVRKGGAEFPVEITLSPFHTDEGTLVSAAIRDVTERKLAADALAHQASHDPLTGLPNRSLFLDRLEHALARARRSQRRLAVMFLDLDDFKLVNDTLGHDAGDQLLLAITPRLKEALRPGDTVARFGGDEFVVLCEDLQSENIAIDIADRIAAECGKPVRLGGREHSITVSAGAVIVEAGDATPSDVLRDADAAMYRAKALGKGRIEVFDESMRRRLLSRLSIESELRQAIKRGEFRLHYQPIVLLARDEIVGFEALLRWEHPERGLLDPSSFIAIAESSGLIVQIGEWALRQACHDAVRWSSYRHPAKPVFVSVNFSARQVARADATALVARVLHESSLDPSLLQLEITESILLDESEVSVQTLRGLKRLGVRIVLDDFGTGYSSLSYLKRFTIDALKIDRSFVDGLERGAEEGVIVNAVLSMAEALGIGVTAEGVETEGQVARLREHGCEFAQGYLFARPLPETELGALLTRPPSATTHLRRLLGRMTTVRLDSVARGILERAYDPDREQHEDPDRDDADDREPVVGDLADRERSERQDEDDGYAEDELSHEGQYTG